MISVAKMDEDTCEECEYFNATDAIPPHAGCTSAKGCRCTQSEETDDNEVD